MLLAVAPVLLTVNSFDKGLQIRRTPSGTALASHNNKIVARDASKEDHAIAQNEIAGVKKMPVACGDRQLQ